MLNKLMPFLAKIIAPLVVGFLAWAADATGVVSLTSAETVGTVTGLIVWGMSEVTSIFISKKTNPSNAATTQLATVDKARNAEIVEAAKI